MDNSAYNSISSATDEIIEDNPEELIQNSGPVEVTSIQLEIETDVPPSIVHQVQAQAQIPAVHPPNIPDTQSQVQEHVQVAEVIIAVEDNGLVNISAHSLAKGLLRFFSKTKDEMQEEIDSLNFVEECLVWREILISFSQITTPAEIFERADVLWKRIKFENLEFQEILPFKETISYYLSQFESFDDPKYPQLSSELAQAFHELIQAIQPLDVELMIYYIHKFEEAAKVIEGKDTILLLGETGAGKSTTIHFLAGSELQEDDVEGFDHLNPIQPPSFLKDVRVAPSTQSVTRSITAVEFPDGMTVCDTPGFGDTEGAEIDISNGIGIIKSLSLANSIKPVMILSAQNMDRLSGIRKMNKILSSMFKDVNLVFPSMTYLFTKYHPKKSGSICQQLTKLKKEFNDVDKYDANYVALVNDVIQKTTPKATIVAPTSDNHVTKEQILEILRNIPPCSNPSELFQTFTSTESSKKLTDQWYILQRQVHNAIQSNRIESIFKPFAEMKILSQLELENQKFILIDTIGMLEKYTLDLYALAQESFTSCLHTRIELDENKLNHSLHLFRKVLFLQPLLSSFDCDHEFPTLIKHTITGTLSFFTVINSSSYDSILKQFNTLRQMVSSIRAVFFTTRNGFCIPHPEIADSQIMEEFYLDLEEMYYKTINGFRETVINIYLTIQDAIQNLHQPNLLIVEFHNLQIGIEVLAAHPLKSAPIEELGDIFPLFQQVLEDKLEFCSRILIPELHSPFAESIQEISKFCQYISDIQKTPYLAQYLIECDELANQLSVSFLKVAENSFNQIFEQCSTLITSHQFNDLKYYLQFLQQCEADVPFLREKCYSISHQVSANLQHYLMNTMTQFKESVSGNEGGREIGGVNISNLCLLYLFEAESMFAECTYYSKTLLWLEESIVKKISSIQVDTENPFKLGDIHAILHNLSFSDQIKRTMASVEENPTTCDKILQLLSSLVGQTLRLITTLFQNNYHQLTQLSFSEYKELSLFAIAINQYLTSRTTSYSELSGITKEMLNGAILYFHTSETNLMNSLVSIKTCWSPNTPITVTLPNVDFTENVVSLKNNLSELREFIKATNEYDLEYSSDLLYLPPRNLINRWINSQDSHLVTYGSEIYKYLKEAENVSDAPIEFTNIIAQLLSITHEMSSLDTFFAKSKVNYSALCKSADAIMRKLTSNIFTSMKQDLDMNRFEKVRETLMDVKRSPINEIKDSFSQLANTVSDFASGTSEALSKILQSRQNLTLDFLTQIIQRGEPLKSLLAVLEEFLSVESRNKVSTALNNLTKYIKSFLNSILDEANTFVKFATSSSCLRLLSNYSEYSRVIIETTSAQFLNLDEFETKSQNIRESMMTLMKTEVDKFREYHPTFYSKYSPKLFVEQLKSFSNPETEALLSTLQNHVITKLKTILAEVKNNVDKDLYRCEYEMFNIKTSSHYLTEEIKNEIYELYENCNKQIIESEEKNRREIREVEDAKLISRLLNLYDSCCQKKDFYQIIKIREAIHRAICQQCFKFEEDLKRKDTGILLTTYPEAYQLWKDYLQLVKQHYNHLKSNQNTFQYVATKFFESHRGIECVNDIVTEPLISELRKKVLNYLQGEFRMIQTIASSNPESLTFLNELERPWGIVTILNNIKTSRDKCNSTFYDFLERQLNDVAPSKINYSLEMALKNYTSKVFKNFFSLLETRNLSGLKAFLEKLKEFENLVSSLKTQGSSHELQSFPSYTEAVDRFSQELLKWKDLLDQQFLGNSATSTVNSADKDKFYSELYSSFCAFKDLRSIAAHINPKVFRLDERIMEIEEHTLNELKKFQRKLEELIQEFPTSQFELYNQFSMCLDNLRSFSKVFLDGKLSADSTNIFTNMENKFEKSLDSMRNDIMTHCISGSLDTTGTLIEKLIALKQIGSHVFSATSKINGMIDAILSQVLKLNANKVATLSIKLSQSPDPIAKRLLQEHKIFEEYQIRARNQKTLKFSIDDVLGTVERIDSTSKVSTVIIGPKTKHILRGTSITDQSRLEMRNLYKQFDEKYWAHVKSGYTLLEKQEQATYLSTLVNQSFRISNDKTRAINAIYQELAALVFSYWTLSKWYSRDSIKQDTEFNDNSCEELLQPHCAQIIAIFRLLGIDCNSMEHHLAQISTGEGKSVTLAGVSIVLALTGGSVDCVCYSDYLSQRDYQDFRPLFEAFRVQKYIKYQTFNTLCESVVNRNGDLRQAVQGLISSEGFIQRNNLSLNKEDHFNFEQQALISNEEKSSSTSSHSSTLARKHILLIDEVDVFLNEDFYGNFYHPIVKFAHPTISALIDYVWVNRGNIQKLAFRNISSTTEYSAVMTAFPKWQKLFDELIKSLCADVLKYSSHDYIVSGARIGYKDQDSISFTLTFGFQTMFAYFDLFEKSIITSVTLEKYKYFPIDCGTFAFAEIPKLYDYILGVSGTLETLSDKENDLLRTVYRIGKQTIIPSVYGANQCSFHHKSHHDFKIESVGYDIAIIHEIKRRLNAGGDYQRAVLVFFESIARLEEFYKFAKSQLSGMAKITEETSQVDKEGNITAAITSGRVTLLTRAFGRGTDFICYDDKLQNSGGIHVLQTFFSANKSEEVQIKGRTARQGNVGSYSLVMKEGDLERIGVTEQIITEIRDTEKYYQLLDNQRARYFEQQYLQDIQHVEEIKKDHEEALLFVSKLINSTSRAREENNLIEFLEKRNLYLGIEVGSAAGSTRTICLLDATGSMSGCIKNAKQSVSKMFERAYDILKDAGMESSFEMQFAAYRNYNAPAHSLLQYSPWSSRPSELQKFLESITANYGMGNEAIEIGLWHVNNQHQIDPIGQIVLIGDQPPNTDAEVVKNRQENSWTGTPFETPTYFQREFDQIMANKIKVHAFYVHANAKSAFEGMSAQSGGESSSLDVSDPYAGELLTGLVTRHILNQQGGGGSRGAALVAAYDAKYGRRGHVQDT